jgi:hypothetical protein
MDDQTPIRTGDGMSLLIGFACGVGVSAFACWYLLGIPWVAALSICAGSVIVTMFAVWLASSPCAGGRDE